MVRNEGFLMLLLLMMMMMLTALTFGNHNRDHHDKDKSYKENHFLLDKYDYKKKKILNDFFKHFSINTFFILVLL